MSVMLLLLDLVLVGSITLPVLGASASSRKVLAANAMIIGRLRCCR